MRQACSADHADKTQYASVPAAEPDTAQSPSSHQPSLTPPGPPRAAPPCLPGPTPPVLACAGFTPFKAPTVLGLYDAIRTAPLQFPGAPRISPPLRDLLQRMLVKDPSQRLGLQEVMAHPWTQTQGLPSLCSLQVGPAWLMAFKGGDLGPSGLQGRGQGAGCPPA